MRPRLLAAAVLVAVAASLLAFQPLRSPWWSGYDYDSVYAGSALTLFRGERSNFHDHPGAILQEGLAAVFTGAWLVSGDSRAERAEAWLLDLDSTRPYLRAFGAFVYVASALVVLLALAWVTRSAWWGLLGGLLFLSAPDVITWAAVVKPDPLLAALAVATIAAVVEAFRRRSGPLYLAAAFLLGFDLSVKVQAIGLVLPFAVALLWRPPRPGWWRPFVSAARVRARAHRRALAVATAVWLLPVVALNALSAPPALKPLAELVGAAAALAAGSWLAWRALRATRAAGLAGAALGSLSAALAGMVVPNLFYANLPAPIVRQAAITLTGGGVNEGARPAQPVWGTLGSWHLFLLVGAVGLAYALARREWEASLWASGAFALGLLAYLRYGELHYYTAAIAAAVPLVLRALQALPPAVSPLVAAAVLFVPYGDEIDRAQARGEEAARTERVNEWVEPRLRDGEVALTRLESSDSRFFHLVHFYTAWGPEPDYRFLPPSPEAARWVREHARRVGYVISGQEEDATALLRDLGLDGEARRDTAAPGFVYRVTRRR